MKSMTVEDKMSSTNVRRFIRDESGGYTIWSLIWFSLYVAMGGLAVDVTDAYRVRTQLQSTADAAALAGVMSLPDATEAVAQAVEFAQGNMVLSTNGNVLVPEDVHVGHWDKALQRFTENAKPLNAVHVITRRSDQNLNPLATNFLRILSIWGIPLDRWNINTEAVAIRSVPPCLMKNGMVALTRST
jgi:Flp pilus assembly protein TadG